MTTAVRTVAPGYAWNGISANTTVLPKAGTLSKVVVQVSAAAASTVIDSLGTTASAGNTILIIPASTTQGTVYTLDWPVTTGITLLPGSGVTLNASGNDTST